MHHQEFIHGLDALQDAHRGCVMTIGSFDGVHLGHQAILEKLVQESKRYGVPSLVMIFEPQPVEFFAGEQAPARLMRLREKVQALFACNVDRVLCLKFNPALRSLSAEAFVRAVLVERLGIRHLEIGDDFRFGCDRAGDFVSLQRSGRQLGFSVSRAATRTAEGLRISSTRIRQLLGLGELDQVAALLGRPYELTGRVTGGRQLGRTLGAPTANIALGRRRSPLQGVFTVSVSRQGSDGMQRLNGVANIGLRPTVGATRPLLEVHLLDFRQDLYGECLQVRFLQQLRNEQKFASLDALRAQIQRDIEQAKNYFQKTCLPTSGGQTNRVGGNSPG